MLGFVLKTHKQFTLTFTATLSIVTTNFLHAEVTLEIAKQKLTERASSHESATVSYDSYSFIMSHQQYSGFEEEVTAQFQENLFNLEGLLTYVNDNSADMREGWRNLFKYDNGVAYKTRQRIASFDTVDYALSQLATEFEEDEYVPVSVKETYWWNNQQVLEVIDDQIVLEREGGGQRFLLAELDNSLLPWNIILGPEGQLEDQTVTIDERSTSEVTLTFTVGAGTPTAYCASESFDSNHGWRSVRSWNHAPNDEDSFIDRKCVWKYLPERISPALSYEVQKLPSEEYKVLLRVFSFWTHECASIELQLPPRYVYISVGIDSSPDFHEVSYLQNLLPEEKLPIAFMNVVEHFGQCAPDCDFVVDGVIDEKDIERVLRDLSVPENDPS